MKKFIISLGLAFVLCLSFFWVSKTNVVFADNAREDFLQTEIETELKNFVQYGEEDKTRLDRQAGSKGEKLASEYIISNLNSVSGLSPLENPNFDAGMQSFTYITANGTTETSQNVGFVYKSATENAKTLVLSAHYDNVPLYKTQLGANGSHQVVSVVTEGVNQSAGSVAMLMALAKHIASNNLTFNFNIEFVFFGASSSSNAGANNFLRAITNFKDKYALILYFGKITVGDHNYLYSQEFNCDYDKYMQNILKTEYGFSNYSKVNSIVSDGNNNYSHVGVQGDNVVFLESGINVGHIFSGNYEGFSSLGKNESETGLIITGTDKDNIDGITEAYGSVTANLSEIANATLGLISKEGFIGAVSKPSDVQADYDFWNDQKFVLFMLGVVMVAIFVIYYAIYSHLYKKSKKQMSDEQLASVVMNIQNEVGDISPELKQKIKEKIDSDTESE